MPSPSDRWMDLSSERKEETRGQISLARKSACGAITRQRRQTDGLKGRAEESKKSTHCGSLATHLTRLLTQIGSKMSLKLPRNWDFNLKAEAAKIGKVRSRSLPRGVLMLEHPLFACWAVSPPWVKAAMPSWVEICIQVDVLTEVSACWKGSLLSRGGLRGSRELGWS